MTPKTKPDDDLRYVGGGRNASRVAERCAGARTEDVIVVGREETARASCSFWGG